MKTFVLVHGAWHGSWCWKKLTPFLTAGGNTVITPNIPWTVGKEFNKHNVDLNSVANELTDLVSSIDGQVILVGHSMAGLLVSMVSTSIPQKISTAVYICGFAPNNGQTINDLEGIMAGSVIAPNMVMDKKKQAVIIPENFLREGFYHDCSEVDYKFAKDRVQPQLATTFVTAVEIDITMLSEVKKIYIECLDDRAIPIDAQRAMQKNILFEEVVSLPASHSVFFSQTDELAKVLLSEC